MNRPKMAWWKLIFTWVLFLFLHYSYETFPNTLFKIIGEEGETTYFHMKMLFFAYLFASILEYFLKRNTISQIQNFVYARMFIAVAYPWLTITAWFTAEALLGASLPLLWEIIYANIMTVFGIYIALRMEELFDRITFRPAFKGVVVVLFLTALLSYVAFSFNTPGYFFSSPPFE